MDDINSILLTQPQLNVLVKDIQKLKRIHQLWDLWSRSDSSEKLVPNVEIISKSIPLGVNDGILTIACESSLIANHLRLISQSIIQRISDFGITGILKIHFSVLTENDSDSFQNKKQNKATLRQVDNETIMMLEKFEASCTSEKMSVSINNLLDTLRSNNKVQLD